MYDGSAKTWAEKEFGATLLGDVRRTRRLVSMAARAARRPSGKISAVFDKTHEREGAYDLLENPSIAADAVAESYFASTVERARCESKTLVYVVVDGSSINLTDSRSVLLGLAKAKCLFTVRSHWDRHTVEEKLPLREVLRQQPSLGSYAVDIRRTGQRAARRATFERRSSRRASRSARTSRSRRSTAVWFRELNADGGESLDWLLFTNVPVTNAEQASEVVDSYRVRWRID